MENVSDQHQHHHHHHHTTSHHSGSSHHLFKSSSKRASLGEEKHKMNQRSASMTGCSIEINTISTTHGPTESRIDRMRKFISSPLSRRKSSSSGSSSGGSSVQTQSSFGSHHSMMKRQASEGSSAGMITKTFGSPLSVIAYQEHHNKSSHHSYYSHSFSGSTLTSCNSLTAPTLITSCPSSILDMNSGCLMSTPPNNNSLSIDSTTGGGGGPSSPGSESPSAVLKEPGIPYIMSRLCHFIESNGGLTQEGIFRISGNVKTVEKLKNSFDTTGDAPLESCGDVASAAALIKLFLRELPDPVIPTHLHSDFFQTLKDHPVAAQEADPHIKTESLERLKGLVDHLPNENFFILKYLSSFLHRVSQNESQNRMNPSSLGIVFGPNIFRLSAEDYRDLKEEAITGPNQIVATFISEHDFIFGSTVLVPYDGSPPPSPPHTTISTPHHKFSVPVGIPLNNDTSLTEEGESETSKSPEEQTLSQVLLSSAATDPKATPNDTLNAALSEASRVNKRHEFSGNDVKKNTTPGVIQNRKNFSRGEKLNWTEKTSSAGGNHREDSSSKSKNNESITTGDVVSKRGNHSNHVLVKSSSDTPSTVSCSSSSSMLVTMAKKEFSSSLTSASSSSSKNSKNDRFQIKIPLLTLNYHEDDDHNELSGTASTGAIMSSSKFGRKRKKNPRGKSLDSTHQNNPGDDDDGNPHGTSSNIQRSVSEERSSSGSNNSGSCGSCMDTTSTDSHTGAVLRPSSASSGLMVVGTEIRRCKSSEEMLSCVTTVKTGPRSFSLRPAGDVEEFRSLLASSGASPSSEPTEAKRRLSSESKSTASNADIMTCDDSSVASNSGAHLNIMRSNESFNCSASVTGSSRESPVTSRDSLLTLGSSVASLSVMKTTTDVRENNRRKISASDDNNNRDTLTQDNNNGSMKHENNDDDRGDIRNSHTKEYDDETTECDIIRQAAEEELFLCDDEEKTVIEVNKEHQTKSTRLRESRGGGSDPETITGVVVLRPTAIDKTKRMNAIRRCSAITRLEDDGEYENHGDHDAHHSDSHDPKGEEKENKNHNNNNRNNLETDIRRDGDKKTDGDYDENDVECHSSSEQRVRDSADLNKKSCDKKTDKRSCDEVSIESSSAFGMRRGEDEKTSRSGQQKTKASSHDEEEQKEKEEDHEARKTGVDHEKSSADAAADTKSRVGPNVTMSHDKIDDHEDHTFHPHHPKEKKADCIKSSSTENTFSPSQMDKSCITRIGDESLGSRNSICATSHDEKENTDGIKGLKGVPFMSELKNLHKNAGTDEPISMKSLLVIHDYHRYSWPCGISSSAEPHEMSSSTGAVDNNNVNDERNESSIYLHQNPSSYPLTKIPNAVVTQLKRDENFLSGGSSSPSSFRSASAGGNTTGHNNSGEAPVSPSAFRAYLAQRAKRLSDPSAAPSPPIEQEIRAYPTSKTSSSTSNVILKEAKKRSQFLKSAIKEYETNFENKYGHRPSYEQKMSSPIAKPMMTELNKLKKGMREIKSVQLIPDPDFPSPADDEARDFPHLLLSSSSASKHDYKDFLKKSRHVKHRIVNLDLDLDFLKPESESESTSCLSEDILNEIMDSLSAKRTLSNRSESIESMTPHEILDEKLDLQKALLKFESIHGRPSTKKDRDIMRPVYDRYRIVKRMVARMPKSSLVIGSSSTTGSNMMPGGTNPLDTSSSGAGPISSLSAGELQPILEHVVMSFASTSSGSDHVKSSPAAMISTSSKDDDVFVAVKPTSSSSFSSSSPEVMRERSAKVTSDIFMDPKLMVSYKKVLSGTTGTSGSASEQNFHELPLIELLTQLRESRSEKRHLRRIIKNFEEEFIRKSGRKVEKDDRTNLESVYSNYKHVKGKLRLLEALVSKTEKGQHKL